MIYKDLLKIIALVGLYPLIKRRKLKETARRSCVSVDGSKALLELIAKHAVKPTVKVGDKINYTMVIRHNQGSKVDAVNVIVSILLPASVKFGALSTTNNTAFSSKLQHANQAEFKFDMLPTRSQARFNFTAIIIDHTMASGLHYATTSMKVSHQSVLVTGGVSSVPFQFSNVFQVPFFVSGCLQPVGMSDGKIKFYQVSASSTQSDLKPYKARFNGVDDAWCADVVDRNPYVQVYLERLTRVTGIATWGRKEKALWVKKYTLEFSLDGLTWNSYGETGITKKFHGNSDRTTKVLHWLIDPVVANFIRIRPIEWSVGVCMRFELYGCKVGNMDNCIAPLGMENGAIPAESFSSLLPNDAGIPKSLNFSRLNKVITRFPFGWIAAASGPLDWIQVDMGSIHRVSAMAIQGGWGRTQGFGFVTKLMVRYGNETHEEFTKVKLGNGLERMFQGQQGGMLADIVYFPPTLIARYFRFIPVEAMQAKVMRFELYGCMYDPQSKRVDNGITNPLKRRSVFFDTAKNVIFVCVYSDNKGKSMCKRSTDGKLWTAINPSIIGILYQIRTSRRLYAINRNHHKSYSDDMGDTWYSISDEELARQIKGKELINSTNIENILPSLKPESKLTWSAANGQKWGVSGNGVHTMDTGENADWVLSATWKCCGS